MEITAIPIPPVVQPIGTGGFLDPDRIAEKFRITEGMKVADFGSGSGYLTISMAQRVGPTGKVYAVDVLEDKLDNIRAKARSHGIDNLETIRADLEILGSSGLSDNSQDLVLLANILFQSSKRENIIKESTRVLKKGGTSIIIDWNNNPGGFGPPSSIRLDQSKIREFSEKAGLSFVEKFDAGQFHFGLIFKK